MNRFEQRMQKRMLNPEFDKGYREMGSQIQLIKAIEQIRESQHISKEELAKRMGKRREVVSRLLNGESNPTLQTLMEVFEALGITAEITLRPSQPEEEPIKVVVDKEFDGKGE